MFFTGWTALLRVALLGILAYFALVFFLRIFGKRTLSKMNAFDFVITIAIGSTLSTILLSKTVALADGILALILLIFLQYIVTWLSTRSSTVKRLIKNEPTMLFHQGKFLQGAMRQEHVVEEEILQAIRSNGYGGLEAVAAIVLETDGNFSVIPFSDHNPDSILSDVS